VEGEVTAKEELLMCLEGRADLHRKGSSRRVVRRWRECDVDDVPLKREDDASYVEEGRFVVVRIAEDGAEAGYHKPSANLAKREALDHVLEYGGVERNLLSLRDECLTMQRARYQDEEVPSGGRRVSLQCRVVGHRSDEEDVNGYV